MRKSCWGGFSLLCHWKHFEICNRRTESYHRMCWKTLRGRNGKREKKNNKTGTRNTTLRPEFSFLTPNTHISWGRRLRKSSNLASKEQGRSKHTCEMRSWQAASSLSLAFIFLLESIWALSSCLLRFTRDFTSDFILLMYSRAMVNSSSITPFTSAN